VHSQAEAVWVGVCPAYGNETLFKPPVHGPVGCCLLLHGLHFKLVSFDIIHYSCTQAHTVLAYSDILSVVNPTWEFCSLLAKEHRTACLPRSRNKYPLCFGLPIPILDTEPTYPVTHLAERGSISGSIKDKVSHSKRLKKAATCLYLYIMSREYMCHRAFTYPLINSRVFSSSSKFARAPIHPWNIVPYSSNSELAGNASSYGFKMSTGSSGETRQMCGMLMALASATSRSLNTLLSDSTATGP
jgi:hypothetical protein